MPSAQMKGFQVSFWPIASFAAAQQLRRFGRKADIDFGGSHKRGTQLS
jgi:hypothetical protein